MIDRKRVVERHFPTIQGVEKLSPLSLGNGNFGFSADFTGLQTFPDAYDVPLGTQSQWGWHYTNGTDQYNDEDIVFQEFETHRRKVAYPLYPEGKDDAYHWLRQNPHRLQLGQISFRLLKSNQEPAQVGELEDCIQTLNLWEGILHSTFYVEGVAVHVTTVCHPNSDQIAVKVVSPLLRQGRIQVMSCFSAPDMTSRKWQKSIFLNHGDRNRHLSKVEEQTSTSALIKRTMDDDGYFVAYGWSSGEFNQVGKHEFILTPATEQEFTFSVGFAKEVPVVHSFAETVQASKKEGAQFWTNGAFIDFAGSTDPRAHELERRVILSQYLTKVHNSGSIPPQETGYMYNSWFGKFHLEMHWWHGAHFPIWNRGHLLAESLDWYHSILPYAQELAKSQGYGGARWPKMIGIDGKQSPSPIAPVLIWQQPHPIALAELCYRANPEQTTLERWKRIVRETANFMVSFAEWDEEKGAFVLGPPLIPAQENHKPEESSNPTFELEYWKFGLEIAIQWMERLGADINPKWVEVAAAIAEPTQKEGVYLAHEDCPDTFTKYNHDHPSMLGALGILPGTLIDPIVMKQTLDRVLTVWEWDSAWGWDFPMCAMTAARLGERKLAVDFLLMDVTKNTYLPNGHNYQNPHLTAYLPGNGGLLTAVGMMACGWQGMEEEHAPGFPTDGTWSVQWENLNPIL